MIRISRAQAGQFAGQVALGTLCIALVTLACFPLHVDLVIPGLLYLVVIVFLSLSGGFGSSATVAIVAAVFLEYFFIPPVLEWQINDPEDGVALATYLVTSLVITRLASKARNQARAAEEKRKETSLLYDVASRLLSLGPEVASGESVRIFRDVFGLRAACLFDAISSATQIEGESLHGLAEKTRDACLSGTDHLDPEREIRIRRLYAGQRCTGAIGFEGPFPGDESITLPLSVLAATALERMHTFNSASRAAADARAEILRSAILDAFAHEFKTPLAIILAAAGGLRDTGEERPEHLEMTEIIESQTLRLSRLTTRLLRIARLDRDEVRPSAEPTSLGALLREIIDQCSSQYGPRISDLFASESAEVMVDPELMSLAITQLVDNACKYSFPDSLVTVDMQVADSFAEVRVCNGGHGIPPEEQEQIFERFFRGIETERMAPGAGLGLYVARKIVRAHGGVLDLDPRPAPSNTTTFRIRLPILQTREVE
jgi:two-component system sensor histidine kinase KdpD